VAEPVDAPGGEPRSSWTQLAADYEQARGREDSLDRLLDWPAELAMLGDLTGMTILDVGCGSGAKDVELLERGAAEVVGIDIAGQFVPSADRRLTLVQGDLSQLDDVPAVRGRSFDRILFLQSLGYAADQAATLRAARRLLSADGFIVVVRSHPIRFAVERAKKNGTLIGQEYFGAASYSYPSGWNEQVTVTHKVGTVADMVNAFAAAGLWIEEAVEPQLSLEARRRFPHKQAWLDEHLGVIVFKLRPAHSSR
jgi:ubiquinone/menaquinone biosynthesis C-methylase UbiE